MGLLAGPRTYTPISSGHENSEHYVHCLPLESAGLSSTGRAVGFDLLRWGESFHSRGAVWANPIAIASQAGIEFLLKSSFELRFIKGHNDDEQGLASVSDWKQRIARRRIVDRKNFFIWQNVTGLNEDFILSLHWVPEDPISALEALAMAANG